MPARCITYASLTVASLVTGGLMGPANTVALAVALAGSASRWVAAEAARTALPRSAAGLPDALLGAEPIIDVYVAGSVAAEPCAIHRGAADNLPRP